VGDGRENGAHDRTSATALAKIAFAETVFAETVFAEKMCAEKMFAEKNQANGAGRLFICILEACCFYAWPPRDRVAIGKYFEMTVAS
jgi:hypothetical protein